MRRHAYCPSANQCLQISTTGKKNSLHFNTHCLSDTSNDRMLSCAKYWSVFVEYNICCIVCLWSWKVNQLFLKHEEEIAPRHYLLTPTEVVQENAFCLLCAYPCERTTCWIWKCIVYAAQGIQNESFPAVCRSDYHNIPVLPVALVQGVLHRIWCPIWFFENALGSWAESNFHAVLNSSATTLVPRLTTNSAKANSAGQSQQFCSASYTLFNYNFRQLKRWKPFFLHLFLYFCVPI